MKRAKVLSPATIIPPHLYVPREADRQLHDTIQEMGRPAYVLVARQMGKTNLLLHAKRTLETANDIYVYIDLSNRFFSIKELFRHVIEVVLNINPGLQQIEDQIVSIQSREIAPHREYEQCLRAILKQISGRFVIILDEIDSLASCEFSDQFFSQIRSMYFARTNYSEFERLTYVLSGVAEPSDLIRDKTVSPFNIGQKIYLDDFSRKDVDRFISKADLIISEEIGDRIFWWTDGNPRMTWDICSEIEAYVAEGTPATCDVVDIVVEKLYLTHFNKAPVDHIRSLVEADRGIRDSVLKLRANKESELDDQSLGRLYLAGIIKSEFLGGEIRIKNRVIDRALSARWLADIRRASANQMSYAMVLMLDAKYDEALDIVSQELNALEAPSEPNLLGYYIAGACSYYLNRSKSAIEYLEYVVAKGFDGSSHYRHAALLQGISFIRLDRFAEAIEVLNVIANSVDGSEYKLEAMTNLGVAYTQEKVDGYVAKSTQLFEAVLENVSDRQNPALKLLAHFNAAQTYLANGEADAARGHLTVALTLAKADQSPVINLALFKATVRDSEKKELLDRLCDDLLHVSTVDSPDELVILSRSEKIALGVLLALSKAKHPRFIDLLDHIRLHVFKPAISRAEAYYSLWGSALVEDDEHREISNLLESALTSAAEEKNKHLELTCLTLYSLFGFAEAYAYRYVRLFAEIGQERTLTHLDVQAMARVIPNLIRNRQLILADAYLVIFGSRKSSYDGNPADLLLVEYFRMEVLDQLGKKLEGRRIAQEVMRYFDGEDKTISKLLPETVIGRIYDTARAYAQEIKTVVDPFRRYGKNSKINVRYDDGAEKFGKFKLFEDDLRNGRCEIVGTTS